MSIDSSTVIILIPINSVGSIAVSVVGSLDAKTRGDRVSKFFSIVSGATIFFMILTLIYAVGRPPARSTVRQAHS